MYRRRRRFRRARRRIYRNFVNFTEKPIVFFTHRIRVPNAVINGAGHGKGVTAFSPAMAIYDYPVNGAANGFFHLSEPLKALVLNYERYNIVSVKMILNNFRFRSVRIYGGIDVSDTDWALAWEYFISKYYTEGDPTRFDASKFTILDTELLTCPAECFYDHSIPIDSEINYDAIKWQEAFPPQIKKILRRGTRIPMKYYPRCLKTADTNKFFVEDVKDRTFLQWMREMGATVPPPRFYLRPSVMINITNNKDGNLLEFTIIEHNVDVYYRFKFCGLAHDRTF